ncbi:RNA-binding protein 25 [Diaphorina citri]|uniref:RNA-binding protein 25 n=1 Tax=Diaphorina citri TaxID=121845 RepID=A0A3Q0IXJ1_DIACI|nr:RNA-binding protein 25 [Diaphorina citri]
MSYPGRPALVPGLPMGMPYMPLPGAPPMVPAMMPVPHMMNTNMVGSGNFPPSRRNKNVMQQPPSLHKANQMLDIPKGPPVTLFVGNITERAPDPMIRHILQACGHVNSWKKVSGFGFCEYANPDAGLRAIRLLHEKEIGEKKLVVTVDAKAKTILDEYKQTRKAALKKKLEEKRLKEKNGGAVDSPGDKSPTLDENDDYDDDFTREEDKHASDRIGQILRDYRKDMERHKANEPVEERPKTGAEITQQRNQHTKIRLQQLTQAPSDLNQDPEIIAKLNLDTDIEKKDIITREIGKFREIMKVSNRIVLAQGFIWVKSPGCCLHPSHFTNRQKEISENPFYDLVIFYGSFPLQLLISKTLGLEKAEAELAANADSSAVDGAGVSGPPINQDDSDDDRGHSPGGPSTPMSPDNDSQDVRSSPPPSSTADKKKKKLDVKEVFNNDEDEEDSRNSAKKRKLVPLDYGDEKKKKEEKPKDKEDTLKSLEEKKKYIKSFIEKIPTDKKVLFNYQIDWAAVDNQLMERKIRPWINKKIIEYIGEPEPTLVDFICSKVLAGSAPQGVLDDVQMVLDEEAEIFVVKMWRLLIYETEAKKLGLGK